MRKGCPHCGAVLYADASVSSWAFLKCYQCHGLSFLTAPSDQDEENPLRKFPRILKPKKTPPPPPLATMTLTEPVESFEPIPTTIGITRQSRRFSSLSWLGVAVLIFVIFFALDYSKTVQAPSLEFGPPASDQISHSQSSQTTEVPAQTMPEPVPIPVQKIVQVTAPVAILRAGPGTTYRKVGLAEATLKLPVKSIHDDWIEVEHSDGTAWIRSDLVRELFGRSNRIEKAVQ